MSYKKGSYIALALIAVLGIVYFISLNSTTSLLENTAVIGPTYFPNLLTAALLILCVISLIQTIKKKDERIVIAHFKSIVFGIGATLLFIALWYIFGIFYIFAFLYLLSLFTVFKSKFFLKSLFVNALLSLGVVLIIYWLFEYIMVVPL